MCHCLLLLSREVSSELKKLTEVLEKLQHRPRDAEGRNLYDEVCYVIVYSCLITLLLLLTHREMTIYCIAKRQKEWERTALVKVVVTILLVQYNVGRYWIVEYFITSSELYCDKSHSVVLWYLRRKVWARCQLLINLTSKVEHIHFTYDMVLYIVWFILSELKCSSTDGGLLS